MNFMLSFYVLTGVMLGIEFVTTQEEERFIVIDLLVVRIMVEY